MHFCRRAIIDFEEESGGMVVDLVCFRMIENSQETRSAGPVKSCNCQIICNLYRHVGVRNTRHSGCRIRRVTSKCVTAPKELANIAADIVIDDEGTARMVIWISLDIEHEVVENNQLLSICDTFLEFFLSHDDISILWITNLEHAFLSVSIEVNIKLEANESNYERKESYDIQSDRSISAQMLIFDAAFYLLHPPGEPASVTGVLGK